MVLRGGWPAVGVGSLVLPGNGPRPGILRADTKIVHRIAVGLNPAFVWVSSQVADVVTNVGGRLHVAGYTGRRIAEKRFTQDSRYGGGWPAGGESPSPGGLSPIQLSVRPAL